MLTLYKLALGPLLLLQGRSVRKTALRLPEAAGPRAGAAYRPEGRSPVRILFVGDSSVAGVGVEHQDHALAAQASALLSESLKATFEWQVVAKSGVNTREALDLVAASDLRPADLLVISLGTNDVTTQRSMVQFLGDYQTLVDTLTRQVGARAVIVTGIPPLHVSPALPQPLRWYIGRYARKLDAGLRRWTLSGQTRSFVSLQWAGVVAQLASDGYHPGAAQYTHWAGLVAEHAAAFFSTGALRAET